MSEASLLALKSHLEEAAAHLQKAASLVASLNEAEHIPPIHSTSVQSSSHIVDEQNEIAKVRRKLPRWATKPNQNCTQVLRAYIQAKREGVQPITTAAIQDRLADPSIFPTTFAQMKNIAQKNNGKVFDQVGDEVRIWPPVAVFVDEFERRVFGESDD